MNEEKFRTLRERLLESLEEYREIGDQEIYQRIDELLLDDSMEHYMRLAERYALRKELFNSIRRLDILQELLEDDTITEIMVNGTDGIFIERYGRLTRWEKCFGSAEKLQDIAQQIVGRCNRIVNEAVPIVDARLEHGERVNIVMPPVALNGPVITIRRFPNRAIRMEQLVNWGSISAEVATLLRSLVCARYNIFISGGTGSGKTTFLNTLSDFIPKDERIITIEDNAELQIQGVTNLVRLEARNANTEGKLAITIRDLIRASLRMRPDRILIGEIRGAEAIDLLQALNTGHDGSLSTGHANTPQDMLSRIETMALMDFDMPLSAIRRQIASGIDLIVHLGRLRDKTRKVLQILEILGYDPQSGEIRVCRGGRGCMRESMWKAGCEEGTAAARKARTGRTDAIDSHRREHPYTRMSRADVGRYLAGDLTLILLLGWLFYDSLVSVIVLFPGMLWMLREQKRTWRRRRKREMQRQFLDAIQMMAASLQSGYSVENSVLASAKELEKLYQRYTFIVLEFQNMALQLDRNQSVESLLQDLGERSQVEDLQSFAEVFLTVKRTGGDLLHVIRNTVSCIRQKQETVAEIETVLTGKMTEQKVMSLMPLLILLYVRLTSPEFLSGMYGNLTGRAVMTVCLLIYAVAYLWGKKIVGIEV